MGLKRLSKKKEKRILLLWEGHQDVLANKQDFFHSTATKTQAELDKISRDVEIQMRLFAALVDARNYDDPLHPSKKNWLMVGEQYGVKRQMESYIDEH